MNNPCERTVIEFHILQSFPVTCLNRDDVGAPKSAIVGGVPRARVSSQCWKRQVRLALHDCGIKLGIRTKRVAELVSKRCVELGAEQALAQECGAVLGAMLASDTLYFITDAEVTILAEYAQKHNFVLPIETKKESKGKKKNGEEEGNENDKKTPALPKAEVTLLTKALKEHKSAADGLDIALFGRMVAQNADLNIQGAASFSHAISTHRVSNEVEFFTALDDLQKEPGSAHMGSLEFNSATYYRYISLDLGQLWENLGGEGMESAVEAFTKALYVAVPAARQATQSGACPWEYARVLVRKGQRLQAPFDKPVRAKEGFLQPSIDALNAFIDRQKKLSGSLYGEQKDITFGLDLSLSIDDLAQSLAEVVHQGGAA
ncbi:MAG: type I-E CRISPR-associated protein Cas7/Cse4/CasC [Desulfovibrionaceae bacterium]|nr:type I-E CRISPR-associated protein Cas7/Cse4/CasC [Desulfovibrionaceae bacterium]